MTKIITIETEHFPPSVNNLFATVAGGRRVRTKRYKDWAAAAGWDFNGKGSIHGPFEVRIILSRKRRRKGQDIDNLLKAPIDLLVAHHVVDADDLCEQITVAYGACVGMHIEVRAWVSAVETGDNH